MSKRLFVGNLAYSTNVNELETAFAPYGVSDVHMPTDRMSGQPRGFAFVTVEDNQAQDAIRAFDGQDLGGRALTVNEAKPREDRGSSRGDYAGGRSGGGNRW